MQPDPSHTQIFTRCYDDVGPTVFKNPRRTYGTPTDDARCDGATYRLIP